MAIPKRFIRIWFGNMIDIPNIFQVWWKEFKNIHPDYEFVTITNWNMLHIPDEIKTIIPLVGTRAGWSDIARILALHQYGGIYVDTDVMPLKSFNSLINSEKPFLGKRSSKSFESAIIGSPKNHTAIYECIQKLPKWFYDHINQSASVQTGPAFVSSVLFGREDVMHLPSKTFYPYNGFMAPKRHEKEQIFKLKQFPNEMIAAHFSNHKWGGNPNKK